MQNVILNAPPGFLIDEIHRKDMHIHEQQKKIDILESELIRSKQKIEELLVQLSKCTDGSYKASQGRYWSPEEHQRFLEGLKRFGAKDVKAISIYVGTRNATQVRTHAQKYFLRMEKEKNGEGAADNSSNDEKNDDALFNNNKGKDDQFEHDTNEEASDKDPAPTNNNNNVPNDPSDETSPLSTPPGETSDKPVMIKVEKKPEQKPKAPPKKRKATKKRSNAASRVPDSDSLFSKTNDPRSMIPSMPLTSFLPHHGFMGVNANVSLSNNALSSKIIAETSETVLFNMKNWSQQDYILFVEGLISVQEEKDNTLKCMAIRDKYLPHHSLDDVLKCYSLLQGVAMKETHHHASFPLYAPSDLDHEAKRIRLMNPSAPSDLHFNPIHFSGNLTDPVALRFPYGNPYHPMANQTMRYPGSSGSLFPFPGHSDGSYFPAFPPVLENQGTGPQRSNSNLEMMPRINPSSSESEFDTEHY